MSSYQLGAPGAIAAILTGSRPICKIMGCCQNENWDIALDLHQKLMPLWDAIGLDNMPSLCKYAQKLQGLDAGYARKPTSPATKIKKKKSKLLKGLGLI